MSSRAVDTDQYAQVDTEPLWVRRTTVSTLVVAGQTTNLEDDTLPCVKKEKERERERDGERKTTQDVTQSMFLTYVDSMYSTVVTMAIYDNCIIIDKTIAVWYTYYGITEKPH